MISTRHDHSRPSSALLCPTPITKVCPDHHSRLHRDYHPSNPSISARSQIFISSRYAAITSGDADRIASAARASLEAALLSLVEFDMF